MTRKKIPLEEIHNFAALLEMWSQRKTSTSFRQFYRSVGLSEMQFYNRIWISSSKIPDFDIKSIRENLKINRSSIKKKIIEEKKSRKIQRESKKESIIFTEEEGRKCLGL